VSHRTARSAARRPFGVAGGLAVAVAAVVASLAAVGLDAAAPTPAAATTSGCRAVGGGPIDTDGGPNRATVVVDTGSGPVWSACISFSGAISGIEALDRAATHIADLHPVYEQYSGLGRAVCRLRGVGTDPPDCLGKSVNYWSFSHNGRMASVGAGAVTVRDGDVQGWRHGTGGLPRSATAGTEATVAPPPTTTTRPAATTTTPAPTSPTTRPPAATLPGAPSSPSGSASPAGSGPGGSPSGGGVDQGTPGRPAGTGASAAETVGSDASEPGSEGEGTDEGVDGDAVSEGDHTPVDPTNEEASVADGHGDEQAFAAPGATSASSGGSDGSGSSMGSALGFVVALALVGSAALVVRRRRLGPSGAPSEPTLA
jgi:hypothetical protein